MAQKKKLGEMLLENGLVGKVQLDAALRRQKQWGGRLGENLVELGFTSEINLLKFLSKQLDFPCADLSKIKFDHGTYDLISIEIAQKYNVIPLHIKEGGSRKFLFLAMPDPTSFEAIDGVRFATGLTVKPVIGTDSQIKRAIEKYYLKNNVEIRPLTEKIPVINQEEMEIIHEVPLHEIVDEKAKKTVEIKDPELRALLGLLIEKGIITKTEYSEKLKQVK